MKCPWQQRDEGDSKKQESKKDLGLRIDVIVVFVCVAAAVKGYSQHCHHHHRIHPRPLFRFPTLLHCRFQSEFFFDPSLFASS